MKKGIILEANDLKRSSQNTLMEKLIAKKNNDIKQTIAYIGL